MKHILYKKSKVTPWLLVLLTGCTVPTGQSEKTTLPATVKSQTIPPNPASYFEIPVINMERAIQFYRAVFGHDFTRVQIDGNDMALFPLTAGATGITGALAKGESYQPSLNGSRIYLHTDDIAETLSRAVQQGGKILYPKTNIGAAGVVAEFQDSEGNRIALHTPATN